MDMLENQIMDFRMSLVMICYNPDFVSVLQAGGPCANIGDPVPTLGTPSWEGALQGVRPELPILTPSFLPQEKLKPGYLEQLPGKLKLFSNFLGDRKWFAGEKVLPGLPRGLRGLGKGFVLTVSPLCPQLTFVDFLMFDVLDQNRIFEPKCLEPYKNLKDFMDRFGVSRGTPRAAPLGGGVPDTPCVSPGSGEGGCLHEVQPRPEDAHQQQDGQVGQQEAVGAQHGVGGSPNPAPPAPSILRGRWHHWHGTHPHVPPKTINCFLDVASRAPHKPCGVWGALRCSPWLGVGGCGVRGVPAPRGPGVPVGGLVWGHQLSPPWLPWERSLEPPFFPPPLLISTFLMSSNEAALTKPGGGSVGALPPTQGAEWGGLGTALSPGAPRCHQLAKMGTRNVPWVLQGGEMLCACPYSLIPPFPLPRPSPCPQGAPQTQHTPLSSLLFSTSFALPFRGAKAFHSA